MAIGVCITTRNEEKTIGALVQALSDFAYSVYIVDAASTDETCARAREAGATEVVALEYKVGIASGLMYAWRLALRDGCERIIQIDAGGSHNPQQAYRFARALHSADVVIGSRFCDFATYTGNPKRNLLSRLASTACNVAHRGAHYSDWTSGYRGFAAHAAETLLREDYRARMHGWQIEVLIRAEKLGLKITETPITYQAGRSSFNCAVAREAFGVWLEILKGRFSKR